MLRGDSTEGDSGASVSAGSETIRVLLVDDHTVVRRGLRTFFDLTEDIRVIGEAGDGE